MYVTNSKINLLLVFTVTRKNVTQANSTEKTIIKQLPSAVPKFVI